MRAVNLVRRVLFVMSAAGWLVAAGGVRGQTVLQWKLQPGDSITVTIKQQTDSSVSFGGKRADTKIDLTLVLGWNVRAVDGRGMSIRQSIDSIQQRLTTQQAGTVEFDSSSKGKATGQSRELAEALRPLVGAEFDLTMSPRGEITGIEPANEAAKALIAGLESSQSADGAARATVEQMLKRPLLILPERPTKVGETWTVSSERPTVAGPLKIDTIYQLDAVAEENGKQVARIRMSASFQAAAGGQLTVKSPEHRGEVEFAIDDGRPTKITQQQKLTTERPYRETAIVVGLVSQQTTTLAAR